MFFFLYFQFEIITPCMLLGTVSQKIQERYFGDSDAYHRPRQHGVVAGLSRILGKSIVLEYGP